MKTQHGKFRTETLRQMNNLRNIVFERDSYTCILCHAPASDLHHVVQRSRGGSDTPQNLVSLCRRHHDLVHGHRWHGEESTQAEAVQILIEYLEDFYAYNTLDYIAFVNSLKTHENECGVQFPPQ